MFMTCPSYEMEGGGGEVTGQNAAKPVTTVQDNVLTFVNVKEKTLDIFKETPGPFPSIFMVTKTGILS